MTPKRNLRVFALLVVTLVITACAARQPPNAGGPAPSGPPYPVVLTELSQRRDAAVLAFNRIAQRSGSGNLSEGYLEPVTATIKSLPADTGNPLLLPKVGSNVEMNEEESREALRRFINDWRVLIGSDSSQLSLIERVDQPDRTRVAIYEQRAFRYPLRGDYGKLRIHFTAGRRLLNLTSSCIPGAERLQSMLTAVTPRLTPAEAIKNVRDKGATYTDPFGNQQNFNVSTSDEINSGELVTYVLPAKPATESLEIHLAWELTLRQGTFKKVYVDALNGEIIAVR